jgi:hypothetical protein
MAVPGESLDRFEGSFAGIEEPFLDTKGGDHVDPDYLSCVREAQRL